MSDLIFAVDAGAGAYQTTEHYLRRILAGDITSVRHRLIAALERLEYDIVDDDENVIRGRRAARGWGTSYSSADVLDYPMTLIVKLKSQGEHATRATFDYAVKHPSLSKGEMEILTREAEAISALATVRAADKNCPACGTESTDDSRFCRKCGTKMSVESTELEILRMSAEIRAGYTSVVAAFVASAATLGLTASALVAILASGIVLGKGIGALLLIGVIISLLCTIFVFFGWNRVSRSLRRPLAAEEPSAKIPLQFQSEAASPFLPPASVTERTTNLLISEVDSAKTGEFPGEDPLR